MKYEKWVEYISLQDRYKTLNPSKVGFLMYDKDLSLEEFRELCDFAYMKINQISFFGEDTNV